MTMVFHGYFRSSAAYRCRIAFNLKGIAPETTYVHLRRGGGEQKGAAYRAINPQGLVPSLIVGDKVFTQSLAIIEWLDETQGGPRLLPDDADTRAEVRAFSQVIACDIHPLQNLRVLDYLKTELGHDQTVADEWCRTWLGSGLAACEALLARRPVEGDFCFWGDAGARRYLPRAADVLGRALRRRCLRHAASARRDRGLQRIAGLRRRASGPPARHRDLRPRPEKPA
jgi:maleylacetoacetate isomerase